MHKIIKQFLNNKISLLPYGHWSVYYLFFYRSFTLYRVECTLPTTHTNMYVLCTEYIQHVCFQPNFFYLQLSLKTIAIVVISWFHDAETYVMSFPLAILC